ncbi:phage tail assembly protein [Pantoea sp. Bo_2]|uniref:phage tail assembly protein n=1 Tax=Pantoea TaxID=53335 RepID=UPI000B79BA0C|nr:MULTISPECIES: phage tail assembly protein [Pantoea]KAA5943996.1 phage tail assembly protein [Pantoea sp. VH_3]KAA5951573.1 phage tail assembly protein [Pantoea sp. VH_25]KAA5981573.1 phage tail assembly protein [Pantoea sp. M_3]KAA6044573.1 phage tail assembly protein [Pantoea sp. FN_2b]KAA6048998.1 phage tail assembly protein [Pantoea sp. Bo_5]
MEKKDNVVEFETPLLRGETEIKSVELIKPTAGSLRGVRLADLCQSDVDALLTVLPRITLPALTKAECNALDPVDLITLGGKVIGFLQSKSDE